MNNQTAFNHHMGDTLRAEDNAILQKLGCREGDVCAVDDKRGLSIHLKDLGWVHDPAALGALHPVANDQDKFIPSGCALFTRRTVA